MQFKTFYDLMKKNLNLGSNREEAMRNLISLVCEADPGLEGTEDDPVTSLPASTLKAIASGTRDFTPEISEKILGNSFDVSLLIERLSNRPDKQLEKMALVIRQSEPSMTAQDVPIWCATYFTNILTSATTNDALVAEAQHKISTAQQQIIHRRLGPVLVNEAHGVCPMLGCMNQLIARDDNGQTISSYKVTVIDPSRDGGDESNLLPLCLNHANTYTGTNSDLVKQLQDGKQHLVTERKRHLLLSPAGMEDDIRRVLQKMAMQKPENLTSSIDLPKYVEEKLPNEPFVVPVILAHVGIWFDFIEKELKNLDYSDTWDFESVRNAVNQQYRILKRHRLSAQECLSELTCWLQTTTGEPEKPCESVISYFVQKCEVF